jgi:hypothetical protein
MMDPTQVVHPGLRKMLVSFKDLLGAFSNRGKFPGGGGVKVLKV